MGQKAPDKRPEPKQEEKPEQPKKEQIKVAPEVKAELDKLPGETYDDKIRSLLITKSVNEADKEGKVTLIMSKRSFEQVLAFQPSQVTSDILQKARVS